MDRRDAVLGLQTENKSAVPLKSVSLHIAVTNSIAEVTSNLTYYNEEDNPVEATFTFPVDDSSAVFSFEADIQGRHVKAEIQEKEQAKLTYQDAVDHGRTAMLLKEDSSAGDIFSCTLGNLPPKTKANLTMKYVQELPQESDGKFRFTLPTVLNPRYSPDIGGTVAAEGASYIPPSMIPYDFKMSATVQGYFKVVSVASDVTKLNTTFDIENKVTKVSLAEDFQFDNDLQFLIQYDEVFAPQLVLEDGNPEAAGLLKENMIMMTFYPDLKEVAMVNSGEYVFVIDRSGSMEGKKMEDAKEALLLFAKSLPPDCYFNIVSFGTFFNALFSSGSEQYNDKTLDKALKLIESMSADMGGTEILSPLTDVFKMKTVSGHPRRVFVLTDGEVSNTEQVLTLVREESRKSDTRVFSLGIGYGVSTSLVNGIARNGRGNAEFIAGGQRVQSKVVSLLKCAMQPAVTDLELKWKLPPAVSPIMIPTELPPIISAGDRLTLFAVLQGVDKHTIYTQSTVTLTGRHNNTPISFTMNFTLCEADEVCLSAPVHRLATKAQIKLLQDEEVKNTDVDTGYFRSATWAQVLTQRKRIVDLSCHGNVISKYTAFVAIDSEGQKVEGKAEKRPCPVPTFSPEYIDAISAKSLRIPLRLSQMESFHSASSSSTLEPRPYASFVTGIPSELSQRFVPVQPHQSERNLMHSFDHFNEYAHLEQSASFKCLSSSSTWEPRKLARAVTGIPSESTQRKSSVSNASGMNFMHSLGTRDCDEYGNSDKRSRVQKMISRFVSVIKMSNKKPAPVSKREDLEKHNARKEKMVKVDQKIKVCFTDDVMMSVISLQKIKGFWELTEKLLQLLNMTQEDLDRLEFCDDTSVNITIAVLCWLRKYFSHRHEEWKMIEVKAQMWLQSNLGNDFVDIIKKASDTLFQH